jgi:ABC-type Co2+ transport system permease subunit
MDSLNFNLDGREICKRVIKYALEGLMVAFAALALPAKSMEAQDILGLALVAAATFMILDMYAPSVGSSARQGAGMGIGFGLVGGLPIMH